MYVLLAAIIPMLAGQDDMISLSYWSWFIYFGVGECGIWHSTHFEANLILFASICQWKRSIGLFQWKPGFVWYGNFFIFLFLFFGFFFFFCVYGCVSVCKNIHPMSSFLCVKRNLENGMARTFRLDGSSYVNRQYLEIAYALFIVGQTTLILISRSYT